MRRVEHGFGVFKQVQSEVVPFAGPTFEYYHGRRPRGSCLVGGGRPVPGRATLRGTRPRAGQFHGGKKHGWGLEYLEASVYSGQYKQGMRWGKGRMDFAGGDAYDGDFGADFGLRESLLPGGNPYEFGVPHGAGRRVFADGSVYEGEFREGRVTGRGR